MLATARSRHEVSSPCGPGLESVVLGRPSPLSLIDAHTWLWRQRSCTDTARVPSSGAVCQ